MYKRQALGTDRGGAIPYAGVQLLVGFNPNSGGRWNQEDSDRLYGCLLYTSFLRFRSIGGVDPRMLPGREMVVLTDPPRRGIVTCPAGGEADKSIPLSELFVDVGLSQTEAERAVPVGTPVVLSLIHI